jgi:hypothetical protein
VNPDYYLLLIGELNGCSQHLQVLGQLSDREIIQDMIVKYNKLYFRTKKAYEQESKCHRD